MSDNQSQNAIPAFADENPPRIPGDNPNRRNAQRRKTNRPRTTNQSVSKSSEIGLRWVDPLPVVDPIPVDLEPQLLTVPAGSVELRNDLPETIAEPFCDLVSSVLERTNVPNDSLVYCVEKLRAQSFFKAARQLYSCMTDPEKSRLQPLKAVFYDTSYVPIHMASALSMIGNFESKLGRIEVKHSVVQFKRWILRGLSLDPDSPEYAPFADDFHRYIWRDRYSKLLINDLARARLKEFRDDVFDVLIDGKATRVGVPPIEETLVGYHAISDSFPHADEMRALLAVIMQPVREYVRGDPLRDNQEIDVALEALDLLLAPDELNDPALRDAFESDCREYMVRAKIHLDSVLVTGESPSTGRGFAAQTVSSESNSAYFQMPLSDADRHIGFLFNPVSTFEINPRFVAYSRRRADEAAASFAKKDAKTIAM